MILELLTDYREYLLYERQLSRSTLQAYMSDLRRLDAFLDTKTVAEISRDDLRAFMQSMAKTGLSTATIRRTFHGLSTFWVWLQLAGMANENVAQLLRLPKLKRKAPDWLSVEELERWMNTPAQGPTAGIRARNQAAWHTLAWLGLRRNELLYLKTDDVRLDDREIIIRNAKGGTDRVLPIPEKLYSHLYYQVFGRDNNDLVFPSRGYKFWPKEFFYKAFYAHVAACGLADRDVTPHTLRHTFATQLVRQSVDIATVSKLMGHKDIKTTMIYIHHDPAVMRAAIEKSVLNEVNS